MVQFLFAAFALTLFLMICAAWAYRLWTTSNRLQDVDVYADQLKSLEKDRARGIVSQPEFEAMRTEIARRLLSAEKTSHQQRGQSPAPIVPILVVLAGVVGAMILYPWLGSPGLPDQPIAQRLAQAEDRRANLPAQAELDRDIPSLAVDGLPEDLETQMTRLRQAAVDFPDDITVHTMLAGWESRLGRFPAAHQAQRQVLTLQGEDATATDWGLYSEFLIIAAGDTITAEAAEALRETLRLDPSAPLARFRLGQLNAQIGRPDLTVRIWDGLLREGPETAPYIPSIRSNIDRFAAQAGIQRYEQPSPRGPSLEDIEGARELSDTDRATMIEGMVAGLADRLATQGGPARDWAQLIRANIVLGRTQQARAIYEEARSVFAGQPSDLRMLDSAIEGATP